MKERDRLGAELHHLAVHFEHEVAEFEREDKGAAPPRKIILVTGSDFPRYDPDGKFWKLRHGAKPLRSSGRTLDPSGCLLPYEKKLRFDPKVVAGSLWRLRGLRLAVQKLRADPDVQVYLYDLDLGVEELVTLKGDDLATREVRRFLPLADGDYRMVIVEKKIDPKTKKEVVTKWRLLPIPAGRLSKKDHPERPSIRYFPFVSTISTGEVDWQEWVDKIAKNDAWLKKYEKLGTKGRQLGILDVYRHIEYIGKNKPYVLHEFHQLGHASASVWSANSGTVFVNTDMLWSDRRHPLDLDARAGLDFLAQTIDERLFRMAFAKGAMSTVWGCNADTAMKRVLFQARDGLGGKPPVDDAKLKFRWSETSDQHATEQFGKIVELKAGEKMSGVERSGKWFRERVISILDATYMQHLADASSRCVTGVLPGMYSNYDKKNENGAPCLSHVPMGMLYMKTKDQDFTSLMKFYQQDFGIPFNRDGKHPKFGRGYALYCPKILPAKP